MPRSSLHLCCHASKAACRGVWTARARCWALATPAWETSIPQAVLPSARVCPMSEADGRFEPMVSASQTAAERRCFGMIRSREWLWTLPCQSLYRLPANLAAPRQSVAGHAQPDRCRIAVLGRRHGRVALGSKAKTSPKTFRLIAFGRMIRLSPRREARRGFRQTLNAFGRASSMR